MTGIHSALALIHVVGIIVNLNKSRSALEARILKSSGGTHSKPCIAVSILSAI